MDAVPVKTFKFKHQLVLAAGLTLLKQGLFIFSGYGQTDMILESLNGIILAHKKFQLQPQNWEIAVEYNMHWQKTGMPNKNKRL